MREIEGYIVRKREREREREGGGDIMRMGKREEIYGDWEERRERMRLRARERGKYEWKQRLIIYIYNI